MTSVDPASSTPPDHGAEADSFPALSVRTVSPSFRQAAGDVTGGLELPSLVAAFAAVLSRHNDVRRVRLAVPLVSGERSGLVTLRLDLGEEPTFAGALAEAGRALAQAGRLTGPELADRLAEPAPPCVVSALDRPNLGPEPLGAARLRQLRQALAGAELHLSARPDEDRLHYGFASDALTPGTARRIAEQVVRAARQGAAEPGIRLDALDLAGEEELAALAEVSRSVPAAVDGRLDELIDRQIQRSADRVAVQVGAERTSYRELGRQADWLALRLTELGVGPGQRVGIRLERSATLVAALLAVLRTGAAYVPIDSAAPAARQSQIVDLAQLSLLLTDRSGPEAPPGVRVEALPARLPGAERGPAPVGSPDDTAYVLFTSGSTGRPKGVEVAHRSVVRLFATTRETFGLDAHHTWLGAHAITFDASVWEIYGALLHGGRVVLAPYETVRDPEAMAALVEREGVSMLTISPTSFDGFRDAALARGAGFERLEYVVLCAEALNPAALAPWFDRWGERTPALVNMYGITETTVHSTLHRLSRADVRDGRSRIGAGLPDTPVYVLDGLGRPAPFGVPGEIHVGGPGVALGYAVAPEADHARFTADPHSALPGARRYRSGDRGRRLADGTVEYLGRLDHQVKIRGYRIELGEVEAALLAHPSVTSARAWVIRRPDRPPLLAAAVVAGRTDRPTPADLREFAAGRLPSYAVPAGVVLVDVLPRTANGKLDVAGLPDPFADGGRPAGEADPAAGPGRAGSTGSTSSTGPAGTAGTAGSAGRPGEAEQERGGARDVAVALRDVTVAMASVLGLALVRADANFFESGGDSITAVRLVARLRSAGYDLDLPRLYRARTPRALAEVLRPADPVVAAARFAASQERPEGPRDGLPDGLPEGVVDAFPATRLQRGMFLHAVRDGAHLYHDVLSYTVDHRLEEGPLGDAIREAVAAHPALRSAFEVDRLSGPLQLVHADARIDCVFVDLRDLPADARRAHLEAWAAEQRRVPFDWSVPGLLRVFVHRTGERESVLSLSVHHTVLDGWSAATLVTELLLAHDRLARGWPVLAPRADTVMRRYAELEQATERDGEHRAFWRDYLDGARPTPLPDATGSASAPPGAGPNGSAPPPLVQLSVPLPAGPTEGLAALARSCGVPLKSAYLAVHLAALSFLTGETEVTTGLVTSGRLEEHGGDTALGLFLNTVPLRADVADLAWPELIASVFDNETGLYPHRRFPLERIQAETGTARLCPTAFNYTDFHVYDGLVRSGISLSDVRYHEETDFPLLVAVHEDPFGGPTTLAVSHHTDRPEEGLAAGYAEFFTQLLRHAATDPHRSAVRALAHWARERGTTAELEPGAGPAGPDSLVPVLAERLDGDQHALLLTDGRTEWTRARIAARVAELRGRLVAQGVGPGDRVACFLERGADPLVALLALWSLGASYVPVDATLPSARRGAVLAAARCAVALRSAGIDAERTGWQGVELVLAATGADPGAERTGPASATASATATATATWFRPAPEQEAYVLFTSGSTGEPKGVSMTHRALANLVTWQAAQPEFAVPRRVSQFAPFSFDVSVQEMLIAVVHGGSLHVVPDEVRPNPQALLDFLVDQEIEVGFLPPVALHQLAAAWEAFDRTPARLGHLLLAGEALVVTDTVRRFCAAAGTELVNQYGPTETHVVTSHRLGPDPASWPDRPPIGGPISGAVLGVRDRLGRPVPGGTPGELHVGGAPVAAGYLGADGTAGPDGDRFTRGADGATGYRTGDLVRITDGVLTFAGRADDQVKVRGYRVEPDEVSAVLLRLEGVLACTVQAVRTEGRGTELAAYVVPADAQVTAAAVLEHARAALPEYAVPQYVELLARLPLTRSGKVDARALRAPRTIRPRPGPASALSPVERRVLAVWGSVVGEPVTSPTVSFFGAGGSSLLALTLYLRLKETFTEPFLMNDLFRFPTARGFAAFLARGSAPTRRDVLVDAPGRDLNRIATAAARRRLARGRETSTGE